MNFGNIPVNGAIRLWLKSQRLTKRVPVVSLEENSPMEFVNRKLKMLRRHNCTVEVMAKAGNSFLTIGKFDYSIQSPLNSSEYDFHPNISQSQQHDRITYSEYEGVLAEHYQKWYNEEAAKCHSLRNELDITVRELNTAKNELQLISQRNELDNMLKDIKRDMQLERKEMEYSLKELELERQYNLRELERERNAQSGLGGLMDTIEKNPFLQGLIEKVIDNYLNKPKEGLNGISNIDDPDIKQTITDITNALAKLATGDKEHFGYSSLVIDKVCNDKDMAQYIYRWINTPQEPSATDKTADKQNNSNSDVL